MSTNSNHDDKQYHYIGYITIIALSFGYVFLVPDAKCYTLSNQPIKFTNTKS